MSCYASAHGVCENLSVEWRPGGERVSSCEVGASSSLSCSSSSSSSPFAVQASDQCSGFMDEPGTRQEHSETRVHSGRTVRVPRTRVISHTGAYGAFHDDDSERDGDQASCDYERSTTAPSSAGIAVIPNVTHSAEEPPTVACCSAEVYDQVVHWKKRFFTVPDGTSGKSFVAELASQLRIFVDSNGANAEAGHVQFFHLAHHHAAPS